MADFPGNDGATGAVTRHGPDAPGYTMATWAVLDWPGAKGDPAPSTGGAPAPTTGLLWPRTRT